VPAFHPERFGHHAHGAGFSGARHAARLTLAWRTAAAGQGEPAGAMARFDRLLRDWRHADLACLHRRSRPRRIRSQEDHHMSGPDANAPLLKVENLSVAFRGRVVAEDINFVIERGETQALVGESGSGKSVTALSILKLLPYPAASHPSGRILFRGEDLMTAPPE